MQSRVNEEMLNCRRTNRFFARLKPCYEAFDHFGSTPRQGDVPFVPREPTQLNP